MELQEALTQIAEIRQQVARTQLFRGYRAVPVAFSGILALVLAGCQALWIPDPVHHTSAWLTLWVTAALVSIAVMGIEMVWRCWLSPSSLMVEMLLLAVGQFLPCVLAGGLLMIVLALWAQETLWMLPGLWSILYSLGIFASYRLLPRAIFWVGMYYLGAGLACLALAQGQAAFSPLAMGLPFGLGQLFAAAVLYWTLERNDVELESQDR